MKKFLMSLVAVAMMVPAFAQDEVPAAEGETVEAATEQVAAPVQEAAAAATEEIQSAGPVFHQILKAKFIEGDPLFMSFVAIALVLGMAFVVERIIYLNLSEVNADKLMAKVEAALEENDLDKALAITSKTRGPIASICNQAISRLQKGQSLEDIDKAIINYGALESGHLETNLSWITLFIAAAPSLGFLGTAIGMMMSFDDIEQAGDISPQIVAGGMKVALITTVGGIIVALLQIGRAHV